MVGRNMDWLEDMQTDLRVFPRGIQHEGDITDNNVARWTSKYASVVATAYGYITTDGINEAGLAAHVLWLNKTDYGNRDESKPSMLVPFWIQYYLDNFKTVAEAVRFAQNQDFQVVPFKLPSLNKWVKLHLIIEDATGDSAIFEYINGKLKIYHDKSYITATNDPTYDWQLANLKQYKVFGGQKPLPGTRSPEDRFVRATYYATILPPANSIQDEVAGMLSVINNVAQPYRQGTVAMPNQSKTIWHTVSDLTNLTYYFQDTSTQRLVFTSLKDFNLKAGAPIMRLDINNHPEYVGNVSSYFKALD